MGSRMGYEYRYSFSMVKKDDIDSQYIFNRKGFLFEIRTNFILRRSPEEGVAADAIIDTERYHARAYEEDGDGESLYYTASYRLMEHWMTEDESRCLFHEAFDFAKQKAADPQHASLRVIPVVVDLDVSTVQQEGESFRACMDRAITAQKLVPLYLWPRPLPKGVAGVPLSGMLGNFLRNIRRIRVEDVDEGLALVQFCTICSRNTTIGAQISLLPCEHAFHSHCIVRWLEGNNLRPSCRRPAYDSIIAAPNI